jgi:YVTN family beta-propeller protein
VYVALQYSDAVDVIDTKTMAVITTLRVGQSPMALVYVARTGAASTANLSRQGLGQRVETLPVDVQGVPGAGIAQVRALPGLDEIVIDVRGLPADRRFTVYAARGQDTTVLLSATSNSMGVIPEALAFVSFFDNHYDKVILRAAPPG